MSLIEVIAEFIGWKSWKCLACWLAHGQYWLFKSYDRYENLHIYDCPMCVKESRARLKAGNA